jgi:hypothetical protein
MGALACAGLLPACEGPPEDDSVGTVQQEALAPGGFSGWHQIPNGTFNEGAAITSKGKGELTVVARGLNNGYWSAQWLSASGWSSWSEMPGGGRFRSKPARTFVGTFGRDSVNWAVAGRGMDDAIYVNVCKGFGTCSLTGWQALPAGTFVDAPAITFGPQALIAFARKSDQSIYMSQNDIANGYSVGNWTSWTAVPNGKFLSSPAAVRTGSGVVYLVARGLDNKMYMSHFVNDWALFTLVGFSPSTFTFIGDPAISSWSTDHLDIFAQDTGDAFRVVSYDEGVGFSGSQKLGTKTFRSGPAAWSWGVNHIDIVGRATDDAVWIDTYQN